MYENVKPDTRLSRLVQDLKQINICFHVLARANAATPAGLDKYIAKVKESAHQAIDELAR